MKTQLLKPFGLTAALLSAGMPAFAAVSPCADTPLQKEAECADYQGKLESLAGQSGTGCVNMTENSDYINFTFDVEAAGKYKVYVAVNGAYGKKTFNCAVNGTNNSITGGGVTEEVEVGSFKLKAGENTVNITPAWTWVPIDYVRIEADNAEAVPFQLSAVPVTPGATDAAKQLYTFLVNNFGSKTISGVMLGDMTTASQGVKKHEDVQAVVKSSGKYPALIGVDFMNATGQSASSGNSWFLDYTRSSVELAKETWQLGGIPTFTWHWRNPNKDTDGFYMPSANSETNTTFDFTTAFKPGTTEWDVTSEPYKNMVADIDVIADYFLELQEAGVAGIFRPLHEASGGWFWWGTKGGEAFQQLYRLVFDEMVKVKGVKNLIWVWNPATVADIDWNPGEEYYDVHSIDIYNDAYDYSSNASAFNKLKNNVNAKKLIALSENGPIPDIEKQVDEEAMWSWWMPWYNSWGGDFVTGKTSSDEWTKVMNDERIITLEDMPGWNATSATIVNEDKAVEVYPTKVSNYFIVDADNANVVVVDAAGRVVENKSVNGVSTITTAGWNSGVYFVTVTSANGVKTYKLVK